MFQTKGHGKKSLEKLSETEINNLPDKSIEALVIKMITELGNRIDEYSENWTKKCKKEPVTAEECNNWNKITLKRIKRRLDDREERISNLEDRKMKITQSEHQTEKEIKK